MHYALEIGKCLLHYSAMDAPLARIRLDRPSDWRAGPEAAALLASIALRPPPQRTYTYRWGDTETRWSGRRVRSLRRLHRRAEPPSDTPGWRDWLTTDEQAAVAAALSGRSVP